MRITNDCLPAELKQIVLVYSWDFYVKPIVRTAASKGRLRLIMPIVKQVAAAVSQARLQGAILVSNGGVVDINPPAPSGQIKFGYDRYHHRISATVDGRVDC